MLHEIKNVKQERGGGQRRWFESDGLELVVWLEGSGQVTGFQIVYDLGRGKHALTWRPAAGFAHAAIDAGDGTPFKNLSPILTQEGDVPWREIARLFDAESESLEVELRRIVRDRLAARTGASAG